VLAGETRAAFTINGNIDTGTLQDWINLGNTGFQQQDKLWVYKGSTILPGTTPLTFTTEVLGNGTDIHTLAVGDVDFAETGATLNYTIQVTTPNNGGLNNFGFIGATLDTATNGGTTTALKDFFSGGQNPFLTLTSTNGAPQTGTISGDLTFLTINEAWTVAANGDINQTFNTFTEGVVPEPASMTLWAMLLVGSGIVAVVRRRRQPA
jgi:hypothetical protein